jgi:hypothetical protein
VADVCKKRRRKRAKGPLFFGNEETHVQAQDTKSRPGSEEHFLGFASLSAQLQVWVMIALPKQVEAGLARSMLALQLFMSGTAMLAVRNA